LNAKASLEAEKQADRPGEAQPGDSPLQDDFSAWKRRFVERGGFKHLLDTLAGL